MQKSEAVESNSSKWLLSDSNSSWDSSCGGNANWRQSVTGCNLVGWLMLLAAAIANLIAGISQKEQQQ